MKSPRNRRHDGARVNGLKYQMFRAVLNGLYFSGGYRLLSPLTGGVGAILMLHHVRPARRDRFQPNHLLEVTPTFFERVIRKLRRSNVDLISLDEMHRRVSTGDFPLEDAPLPRFELLEFDKYNRLTVQTSRGCPLRCEFCASSILLTKRYKLTADTSVNYLLATRKT